MLHIAADQGHEEVVTFLIKKVPVELFRKKDHNGDTPLDTALQNGHRKTVESLIGCQPQVETQRWHIPLHTAIEKRQFKTVESLLDHQTPVRIKNGEGDTPLHLAAQSGDVSCAKMIFDKDNYLMLEENDDGQLPLHKAIKGRCNLMSY